MQEKTSAGMPLQRIALAAISLLAGCNDYHGIPLAGTNEVRTHTVLTEDQVGQVYTLAADGVTLDLGGHALTAPDGHYAVNIRASNVTVTNGRMTGGADAGGVRALRPASTKRDWHNTMRTRWYPVSSDPLAVRATRSATSISPALGHMFTPRHSPGVT